MIKCHRMKKGLIIPLTIASFLLVTTVAIASSHDENNNNDNPTPTPQVTNNTSTNVSTTQSGTNNNNNVNTNTNNNNNSNSIDMKNAQTQTLNIGTPQVLAASAGVVVPTPRILPSTGPSLASYALMLTGLPLGLYLRRYRQKA